MRAFLLCPLLLCVGVSAAVKFTDAELSKLEMQWAADDAPEELSTDDDALLQEMERRRSSMPDISSLDPREYVESAKHASAASGPTMLFASLVRQEGGRDWTGDETADLASKWKELLSTGGVFVTVYDISTNKLLVTLQRGWEGDAVKAFLLEQPEVVEVEWDSVKYTPDRLKAKSGKGKKKPKAKRRREGL